MRYFLFFWGFVFGLSCHKENKICLFQPESFQGKWRHTKFLDSMTGRDITSEVVAKNSCALAQMIEFKPGSKAILSQCKTDTMDYEIYQSRGLDYFTNYKQAFWVKKIDCYHLIYTQDKMEIHCIKVN